MTQLDKRMEQLNKLDMRFDGQCFIGSSRINKDFNIPHYEVQLLRDFEWDKTVREFTTELQRRKDNAEFQTLDEVVKAFFDGSTVHWSTDSYVVADWGSKGHKGKQKNLVVKCLGNDNGVGLFHADGVGSEHTASDFFTVDT